MKRIIAVAAIIALAGLASPALAHHDGSFDKGHAAMGDDSPIVHECDADKCPVDKCPMGEGTAPAPEPSADASTKAAPVKE